MTKLPALPAETEQMVTEASAWVRTILPTLGTRYSREWLETRLRQGLRDGVLSLTIKAVEAADRGDEIADAALRDVGSELQTLLVQKGDLADGHLQVVAYYQRAGRRPPHKRRRGRPWYDNWIRDLEICFLIALACAQFNLPPTRNRASRRDDSNPSGTSVIVAALKRNGINIDESSVQQHIWLGLPGELARQTMIERTLQH
jgi:hypothetical protein